PRARSRKTLPRTRPTTPNRRGAYKLYMVAQASQADLITRIWYYASNDEEKSKSLPVFSSICTVEDHDLPKLYCFTIAGRLNSAVDQAASRTSHPMSSFEGREQSPT
ncbi:hypothetical protein, partial [Jiella sonneratiae]